MTYITIILEYKRLAYFNSSLRSLLLKAPSRRLKLPFRYSCALISKIRTDIRGNELFSIIKPEWLRALREKVFHKTCTYAGSYRGVCENPCLLGADGDDVAFGVKQSIALAAARTINPCNHTT